MSISLSPIFENTFLPGFWSEYGMCTEPSGVESFDDISVKN